MALKNWTAAQEAELQQLTAAKAAATSGITTDINTLLSNKGLSPQQVQDVRAFITNHAQSIVDTLSKHYTPTTETVTAAT